MATEGTRGRQNTSQSIDSPLLELFERDLGRGRDFIEAQAVRVVLLFVVCGSCELFLLVINRTSPFRVNSMMVLSYHDCSQSLSVERTLIACSTGHRTRWETRRASVLELRE